MANIKELKSYQIWEYTDKQIMMRDVAEKVFRVISKWAFLNWIGVLTFIWKYEEAVGMMKAAW